jgi:ribosomal protein L7/L12
MDFRQALVFLANNFAFTTNTEDLIRAADNLVLATAAPTLESLCASIFVESTHRQRKILFIKDLRAAAHAAGIDSGLKECKDAVEAWLAAVPEPTQYNPWDSGHYEEDPPF